ncbi:hypothetical protein [Streptomyces sp. MMBL 11-3]|uniref:hypothetical protein n=1 Tax=Streptomyces sp. MMBL 11-3 TaxID=3382639 RepID=UPI0039B3BD9D
MSSEGTNFAHAGRVDLRESSEGLAAILDTLAEHPDAIAECRLAWVLRHGPIPGLRALEYESGLGLRQIWGMTSSEEGGTTPLGLVETIERGRSWDADGREKGSYRLGVSGRLGYTKDVIPKTLKTYPPKTSWGVGELNNGGVAETPRYSAEGTQYEPRVLNKDAPLLWPGLDLWTREELGGEGWRMAVLTFPAWEGSAREWAELAGGRDKAKRLTAKLEKRAVLTKTGKARATRYSLDWTLLAGIMEEHTADARLNPDREEGDYYRAPHGFDLGGRASKVANRHSLEQTRINRPPSGEELEIRRRARNTCQWAKPYFDEALEAEGEQKAALEKVGHVIAGAKGADWRRWFDAGRSLTAEEVAELAPKVHEPTPEEQAATRVRLAEMRARMIVPVDNEPRVEPVAPEAGWAPEEAAQEWELLAKSDGDARLFEVVYGRKPWTRRAVDPREEARRERHRRRMDRKKERVAA